MTTPVVTMLRISSPSTLTGFPPLSSPLSSTSIRIDSNAACISLYSSRSYHTSRHQCLSDRQAVVTLSRNSSFRKLNVKCATNEPLKVMISGAPASGKGTQCQLIVQKFGLVHISTGDLLRAEVAAGTEVGNKAKDYIASGLLVPDEIVTAMVKTRLSLNDAKSKGWLLDGYPRTAAQAQSLNAMGIHPDIYIVLEVPDDILIERCAGRRLDPVTGTIYHVENFPPETEEIRTRLITRPDDTEEKVQSRLGIYKRNAEAISSTYSKILKKIDGNSPKEVVFGEICKLLSQQLQEKEKVCNSGNAIIKSKATNLAPRRQDNWRGIPTRLNNIPHSREIREYFYEDVLRATLRAVDDRKYRLKVEVAIPELNPETDVYRIGTLMELVRVIALSFADDGKHVKVCVQGSMGAGSLAGMPLQLAGTRKILEYMDWGDYDAKGTFINIDSIGVDEVEEQDDMFILVAPQNAVGNCIIEDMKAMTDAAGDRPVILINPRQLSRTGVGSRLLWQEGCLLEPTAREAKERLDEKLLKSQRKSEMKITTTPASNTRLIKQVNQISHEDNNNMRSSSSLAPASSGVVRRQLLPNGQQVRGTTTTQTRLLSLPPLYHRSPKLASCLHHHSVTSLGFEIPKPPQLTTNRRSLLLLLSALSLPPVLNVSAVTPGTSSPTPVPSPPTQPAIDTTITDRVFLDFSICPTYFRSDRAQPQGQAQAQTQGLDFTPCPDAEPMRRVVLGLYGKVVPTTVSNFKAMCTGKSGASYKNTVVHKILPGQFFVAGRQGSGSGREKGEIAPPLTLAKNTETVESRAFMLEHSRPGLISLCLSENDDDAEAKLDLDYHNVEFLITTGPGPCPQLDGRNIVFGTVLEGLDVITSIAAVPTYKPGERIRQLNDLAEFFGDERAQNARTLWNRPLKSIYISDCGVLQVAKPSLTPSLP